MIVSIPAVPPEKSCSFLKVFYNLGSLMLALLTRSRRALPLGHIINVVLETRCAARTNCLS
ncbi:MAG: hypothetical protein AAF892_02880 [Cyanobacteria bacterium P01_D01_bin.71]